MSISSIASSIWSSATTALMPPNSATTPVSAPTTNPNGSSAANATTGSSNPFQALSSDLQAWLTQNQAAGGTNQTTSTAQAQVHHHHHHHGSGMEEMQQDPSQATQSYANVNALPAAPQGQSAAA
jgi:hypothetical protein